MSLNPRYVLAPSLQEYFVDRDTGLPLAGGLVFTYKDSNRTVPKTVYEIQGNEANYTYAPLPNPIVLSSGGTVVDNNYNDILPYWYPFDDEGNLELYYVVVQSALGVDQFVRPAWPFPIIGGSSNVTTNDLINYIPNGQYLEHIDLPNNTVPKYELQGGTNVIAQGGFYIRLDSGATSTNTWSYIREPYTLDPLQSPRYVGNLVCSSPNALEAVKTHGVYFYDVNKFSAPPGPVGIYTYAFWGVATANVPFTIQVYKFFGTGGNPSTPLTTPLFTGEFTTTSQFFNFDIDFGTNAGQNIGTNNDDFVAIEISFPTSSFLNVQLTDHVLVPFVASLDSFPVQTNADMMARGVFGWADQIKPDGSQLFLPPVLTKYGMTWDSSQVGRIGWDISNPLSPNSTSPIPQNNMMPFGGTSYKNTDFAKNGIPFSRLGNVLITSNPTYLTYGDGLPLWGTGPDFVSALVNQSGSDNTKFRITYNIAGTGSTQATEGSGTGFTFSPIYEYNGSTTGSTSFNIVASNTGVANTLIANTAVQNGTVFYILSDAGTSGFTITGSNLVTQNGGSLLITTVSGASLVTGGTGKYFRLQITGGSIQVFWYNVGGTYTPPAPGGLLNEIIIDSTFSAQDVADVTREAINAFNSTNITAVSSPPDGSYFFFYANPASLVKYYVWYAYSQSTVDPAPAGAVGIRVDLPATPTAVLVRDLTRIAINKYQYYIPDLGGIFFRAVDPNGQFDFDAAYRWSYTSGIGGAVVGTYEYQQFLSHNHNIVYLGGSSAGSGGQWVVFNGNNMTGVTQDAGGTETRPTNMALYPYILY